MDINNNDAINNETIPTPIEPDGVITTNNSTKKPFYQSGWWAILWTIVFWPVGLFILWKFYGNQKRNALPRTTTIKKDLEDL
jgi:hypothetical protein